jgi:ATP-dependent RNA helicase DDX35
MYLAVFCSRIRRKRPSLRIIISSATLDATFFLDYFNSGNSPDESIIVSLEGRMFPVEVAYLSEATSDYGREAVKVVWGIHLQVFASYCPSQSALTARNYTLFG